ncbi:unnamed protein product [Ambrosiozyma monospora]|uniref:Unnamed protein product n=1 Tax=Ambrosiozyma monospora TaxID=43982 RepID=A0ACB5T498_AMBMO|nr:unnamed protein product [Ambrosiozyma monospora]
MTFTSLRDFSVFTNHEIPFPIIVAQGRAPGTVILNLNSTLFEINAYELGSWDPSLYAFTDLKYIGTNVTNGFPDENDKCIAGLDNTGYIFGTSSTLFNQGLLQLNTTGLPSVIQDLVADFLEGVSEDKNDIAEYYPNPFYKTEWAGVDSIVEDTSLYLVDGGEDKENIPLVPLIQPEREVDFIMAYDNSMDTLQGWPNGLSMVKTYERQFTSQSNHTAFPYVPDSETFLNLNLTAKPTFFGCYSFNLTGLMEEVGTDYVPPVIVYVANRPFTFESNTSTYQMSYENEEKLAMIENGFAVSTRKNLTLDAEYRACIGCAILQRSRERLGMPLGPQCQKCFDKYCWDGSLDSSDSHNINFTADGMTNGSDTTNASSGSCRLLFGKNSFVSTWGIIIGIFVVCMTGF